jgi:glycosyltransferase involved in cell wall biosynthesis
MERSMNVTPLISVVIPFYRGEDLLGETIRSVMDQTFQDFEIVLVDNNALPRTKEVAEEWALRFPDRIRIVHEPVQGVCSARNKGIMESKGKYIALFDEDDIMMPQRLEKQLGILEKHPEIALVTSYVDYVSHDGKKILSTHVKTFDHASNNLIRAIFRSEPKKRNLASFHLTYPSTYFFFRELALKAGMFDVRFNPAYFDDYDFQTRMFSHGDFIQIPESLALYRRTSPEYEQKRNYNKIERFFLHQSMFMEILYQNYLSRGEAAQRGIRMLRHHCLKKIGLKLFSYPDGEKLGRVFLYQAIKEYPFFSDTWKFYLKSFFPRPLYPRLFWFSEFKSTNMGDFGAILQKIILSQPNYLKNQKYLSLLNEICEGGK